MRLLLFAFPVLLQAQFIIKSPANGQIVTQNSVELSVSSAPAATDRIEYYTDSTLLEPCGVVARQIALGCPQPGGLWSTIYYTLAQGESPVTAYAIAKDVFGVVVATTPTVTFTTKAMGASIWFLNDLSGNISGDLDLQVAHNHPWNDNNHSNVLCSVDGRLNANGWPTSDFLTHNGPLSGPPYGIKQLIKTYRFANGPHELYCANWNGVNGLYTNASSISFTASSNSINTSTGAIKIGYHPLINSVSTTVGQPGRVTLTTSGSCPSGLVCDGATPYYVVSSIQSNIPASTDNFKLSATVGGSPIVPSNQGSGTHSITYSIPNPFYCDFSGDGNNPGSHCIPVETESTAPFDYRRAIVTFSNGSRAMEMRPAQSDCFLTPGQTCSAAPTVYNTDLSTTAVAASVPTYTLNIEGGVSGCFTVSAAGLITAANPLPSTPCFANVLIHCASGACNSLEDVTVRVMAQTTNIFKHFGRSGPARTSYDPSDSLIPRGMFFLGAGQMLQNPWLGQEMVDSGINFTNDGISDVGSQTTNNCTKATNSWNSLKTSLQNAHSAYGFAHSIDAREFFWPPWNLKANATNQTFDRWTCMASIFTDIKNNGQIWNMTGFDEANGVWGYRPRPNGLVGASDYFTSISVSNNIATFTVKLNRLNNWPSGGADWVKISGATNSALNGVHKVFNVVSNAGTITTSFTSPITIANGTYNASTDPSMTITSWHPGFGQDATCVLPSAIGVSDTTQKLFDSQFTSLVSDGSTLTVHWTSHGLQTGDIIRIWQATNTSLLNVNAIIRINADTFTIPTIAAANTYNAGTDPNLYITVDCGFNNAIFSDLMTHVFNSAGLSRPTLSQPILGATYTQNFSETIRNWVGDPVMGEAAFLYTFGYSTFKIARYGYDQSLYEPQFDFHQALIGTRAYQQEPRYTLVQAAQQDALKLASGFAPDYTRGDRPVANNYSLRGASTITTIMQALAHGVSGFQTYTFTPNTGTDYNVAFNRRYSTGIRHYTFGEKWNAQSLAFQLIGRLERYYLQPRLASPYYGPMFYSTARAGSYGNLLLIGSLSEMPSTQAVNLSGCRQSGGTINRYRLTARMLTASNLGNPTSESVTFAPGEVVAYTCQVAGVSADVGNLTFAPSSLPAGATKMAVKVGYYKRALDNVDATECTAGCSVAVDRTNVNAWYKILYLGSDNSVSSAGDPTRVAKSSTAGLP